MAFAYHKKSPAEFEAWAKARYGDTIFDDDVAPRPDNDDDDVEPGPAADPAAAPEAPPKYHGRIEINLLSAIIWNQNLAGELVEQIGSPMVFETDAYRRIATAAFEFFEKYRRPARVHINDLLADEISRGDSGRFIQFVLDELEYRGARLDETHVRDALADYLDGQRMWQAINRVSGLLTDGDNNAASVAESRALLLASTASVRAEASPAVLNAGQLEAPPAPRQWLLGTSFCRRFLSAAVGPGGAGKTSLRLAQAIALAAGRSDGITDENVHRRCRVLYVSLEDSEDELCLRVWAARQYHRIKPEELDGWLFLHAPAGSSKLAVGSKGGITPGRLEKDLRALVIQHRIDLVILDPFIKSYGGDIDENNNSAIDAVCGILSRLSIELNFAPDVLHHDAKGIREAGDSDRGRGASSFRDAGRLVRTVTIMAKAEAKLFGIPEEDCKQYIRYDDAKVNLAPPGETMWFRLVRVAIGNGTADYPSGDTVQTVERCYPKPITENVDDNVINDILDEIDAGLDTGQRYSELNSAKERAAWAVVKKHCPELDDKLCRKLIADWLKSGRLYKKDEKDSTTRKTAGGLYVDKTKRPQRYAD